MSLSGSFFMPFFPASRDVAFDLFLLYQESDAGKKISRPCLIIHIFSTDPSYIKIDKETPGAGRQGRDSWIGKNHAPHPAVMEIKKPSEAGPLPLG